MTKASRVPVNALERRLRRLRGDLRSKASILASLDARVRRELDAEAANIAVLDERGRIVDVNLAWRRFGGVTGTASHAAGIGSDYIGDWGPPAPGDPRYLGDVADAGVRSAAKAAIEDVLAGRRDFATVDYPCNSPTQKSWFEMTVTPVGSGSRRGAIVRHTDVTAKKRVEGELRRQSDFVRTIDESLPVVLYERVARGEAWDYGFSSDRFMQLFGYPPDDSWASTSVWLLGLLHPNDRERVRAGYCTVLEAGGGRWSIDFRARTTAGEHTWFRLVVNVEVAGGREIRSVGSLQDISAEKDALELADYVRDFDDLTGLFSRGYFERAATKALELWNADGTYFAIVIIDVDDFHEINKAYGVDAGDALRRALAHSLASMVRKEDLVARFGDDQIGIIADVLSADDARLFAHKLVEGLRGEFRFDGHFVGLSVSAGIALPREGGVTAADLFHDAGLALYAALDAGGGVEMLYSAGMGVDSVARVALKAELREALLGNQFELYYQPKIDLLSGRVVGCEALIRWNHPKAGLQAPGHFIAVAEQSGLIVPIGEWVVNEACRQSVRWRDEGLTAVPIAINLSAVQFARSDVFDTLSRAFEATGATPGALDVEVTESVFMSFSRELLATLGKIRALGIEISLDDFGTGFSSLAYLARLPLSILKIDQQFVRGAVENPSDAAIVRWVAHLAEELGLRVIAEGVETPEQLEFVRRAGCAEAQGYLLGRPVAAGVFARHLTGEVAV